ncbi:MAG TPA: diacylglycerol kinase family protein [Clostridia bacterium]|nr:diacylglycerol kinase family protein [Clostridia bacterium]
MAGDASNNLWKAFGYAWAGLRWALARERNLRIHAAAALAVLAAGFLFGLNGLEWAVISLTVFFVLAAELFNTALEQVVDLTVGDRYHPLAKIAKDAAAGAVLLAALNAVIVGCIIFGSRILRMV